MLQTVVLALVAGLFAGNGIPHFVRGITKQRYPMVFGNSAIPNLVAGWLSLVVGAALGYAANFNSHPVPGFIAFAVGVLAIGLFYAGPGAFGQPDSKSAATRRST